MDGDQYSQFRPGCHRAVQGAWSPLASVASQHHSTVTTARTRAPFSRLQIPCIVYVRSARSQTTSKRPRMSEQSAARERMPMPKHPENRRLTDEPTAGRSSSAASMALLRPKRLSTSLPATISNPQASNQSSDPVRPVASQAATRAGPHKRAAAPCPNRLGSQCSKGSGLRVRVVVGGMALRKRGGP
jgi:hypothetical protein